VAILLVVLYHCNATVPGGYVGVDVFFVISGFLITSQLLRELVNTGRISLPGFYARRARRILPAATLVTVVTIVASGLLLTPLAAMREFGDARAASVFGANIHLAARDANYFNDGLAPSPMQHYWSLSVEEQFYLVWPLLLIGSSLVWLRLRSRATKARHREGHTNDSPASGHRRPPRLWLVAGVLAMVAALSFVASVVQTPASPSTAYYSIFTRAWELAAGALVALAVPLSERLDKRFATPLTWIGIACIVTAAAAFNASTSFPGDAALLPVAGAVAIIAAGSCASRRWGAEAMLGTAPFQRVGAWSYSWYLWHWPVLILAPAVLGHSLSEMEALMLAALALVFAVLSFVFVERPIRRMRGIVRRPSLGLAGGGALIATALTVAVVAGPVFASLHFGKPAPPPHGGKSLTVKELAADLRAGANTRTVPSNLEPRLTVASQDDPIIATNGCLLVNSAVKSTGCVYGDKASHTSVVLFGDSHAAAWFPAVDQISKREHWRLVVITKSACPAAAVSIIRKNHLFSACATWRVNAEHQIATLHPALVVVAYSQYLGGAQPLAGVPTGYGSTWENGTEATFKFLHRAAKNVLFITDVPMLPQRAPDCVSGHLSDVQACAPARSVAVRYPSVTAQELRLAARNHIHSLDSTPWFCTATKCPVIVGNILLYRDAQHMVPQWSRFLEPLLADVIRPIMQPTVASHGVG
jgi:peptidoglycan/LPS O-acetylase OafA/YrhL